MSIEEMGWVKPDTEAYILRTAGYGTVTQLRKVRIEKVTKSRITVRDGGQTTRQFYLPKHTPELREYGVNYYTAPKLISTEDPRVPGILEGERQWRIKREAKKAAEEFSKFPDVEKAEAATAALAEYIAEFSK